MKSAFRERRRVDGVFHTGEEAMPDATKLGDAARRALPSTPRRAALASLRWRWAATMLPRTRPRATRVHHPLKVYGLAGEEVFRGSRRRPRRRFKDAAGGARRACDLRNDERPRDDDGVRAESKSRRRGALPRGDGGIKATPSGGAFLAAALGLKNATLIEADVVYDLDDLATAVTLEALRVDGRALEAPGFYKWASAARARALAGRPAWKSTSDGASPIDAPNTG